MRGVLLACLTAAAALFGGTVIYVARSSSARHQAAIDRCLSAGGAWSGHRENGFSGTCLTVPGHP